MKARFQDLLRVGLRRFGAGSAVTRVAKPRPRVELSADIVYAIGDVHGCYDQLCRVEDAILRDGARYAGRKALVMLGDYVDRGPASAQVLGRLQSEMPSDFDRVCLCGNHEEMMLDFLQHPRLDSAWMRFGGDTTLRSYGVDLHWLQQVHSDRNALAEALLDAIPAQDRQFLQNLPVLATLPGVAFVHAGLRPGVPLDDQSDEDLLWIRKPFLELGPQLPLTVIHGHTPVDRPRMENGRIGIDTGAYSTGVLTGLRLRNGEVHIL